MFHQFPSDDPSPNLISSSANIIQLGIPENPGHFIVIRVSISSQTLDCLVSDFHCAGGSV